MDELSKQVECVVSYFHLYFTLLFSFAFPTMDELSEQVECVVNYFRLRRVIGLATGAGANVLTRFALNYPEHVQALILANPTAAAAGIDNSIFLIIGGVRTSLENFS